MTTRPASATLLKELLDQTVHAAACQDVFEQRDAIAAIVAQHVNAQAALWLSDRIYPPMSESAPPNPRPSLIEAVIEGQQIAKSVDHSSSIVAAAFPLQIDHKLVGVLFIERDSDRPLQDDEIDAIESASHHFAFVLQLTHHRQLEHWRSQQLALVSQVNAKIANVLDLEQLSKQVTHLILDTFGYYYVALFTLDSVRGVLRLQASASAAETNKEADPPLQIVPLGTGIIGHVGQTGSSVIANDTSQEPLFRPIDSLPHTRTEFALPLKIESRILGVLDVQGDRPGDLHAVDQLVLQALAESIAVALDHAQTCGDLRRRADQLSIIAQVNSAVASILDQEMLLNKVAELIQAQFAYDAVHLFTIDPVRSMVVHQVGNSASGARVPPNDYALPLDDESDIVAWVANKGETALENDTASDPRYPVKAVRSINVRSELTVPLIFSGHVLGVLDVQSDQLDAFDMDDYFAFRALADTIAIALRNANLYRSERWRRQVADSMVQVASMLSSDSLLDEILDAILAELDRTLPCDLAAICLFRDEELSIAAVRGYHAGLTLGEFPADANLWLARAFSANGPLIRPDDSPPDPIAQALAFPDDYSAIAAPLRARGQLGLLYLAHNTSGRYGSESEVVMSAFASYAAVAIENARAYQTSQEQALISTVMLQVAKATQSLDTLDQVLQTIVRLTPMLVGLERCAILLWDESQERFLPTIAYGLNSDQQQIFENWQIDIDTLDPFDRLLLTRSPVVVHDVRTSSELPTNTLESLGFESFLALPLLAQGDILGAMLVDYRQSESGIDSIEQVREESLTIIQGIAHQAAAAIENAQLREAQQEEAYVSTALLQVAQTIASLTDIEDILSAIVRITPILVGVERCVLFLWNNRDRVFQATHAYGLTREMETALFAQRYEPGEFKLLDTIIQQDSPVEYEADGQHLDPGKLLAPEFSALIAIDQPAPRSLLGVPLSAKGDVLAVMLLEETSLTNRFRERRLEIITGITQQAALALQNEQLQQVRLERERMSRELQLAYEIQSTFIPDRLPTLAGWEFATVWRAAREVAGDFFDLIDLPNDKLGLMIADVADKGMPAALFMILTRTLVRAATLEELSPAKVLERVNELLVPDAKRGMFVTAFYAVLSSQDGQITWANAGHNLPLILHNNAHQIEQLPKGGMALGVSRRLELEEHTSTLAPGDFLVLYTDGVTEAQSPQGIMYEGQRLQQTVLQAQTQSAAAMLDAIDNAVRAHVDTAPASDDLTLIVARRLDNGE